MTNLTWTDPGANPGLHDERPVTNCLSYSKASALLCFYCWITEKVVEIQGLLLERILNMYPNVKLFAKKKFSASLNQ
jgi:hypothetical protein